MVAAAVIGSAVVGGVAASSAAKSQSKAARSAANAQVKAADAATALEREIYYDQRDLLEPSIAAGSQAQARRMLMAGYTPQEVKAYLRQTDSALNGDTTTGAPTGNGYGFTNTAAPNTNQGQNPAYDWVDGWNWEASSPSYDWRFNEGERAVERSAAANGGLFSGDTGMALTQYGQDMGRQEYEADWSRLGELVGSGEDSTGTAITVAGNFGNSAAANTIAAGNARATGYQQVGAANANAAYGWGNAIAGGIGAWGQYGGWK